MTLLMLLAACAGTPTDDTAVDTDADTDADSDADADADSDADADADADSDADTDLAGFCAPWPAATGTVHHVSPSDDLEAVIEAAATGDTVELAAGTYTLDSGSYIHLVTDEVTVRGATGDPADVIIDGAYDAGFGFVVAASDIVIADLTVTRAYYHPIHVTPSGGRSITGTVLYNLRVVDPGEQAIKINTAEGGTRFADDGLVACSHIELTDTGRPHIRNNCYTGGVDAHQARDWVIRDNHIAGFWCDAGLSEHGIHLWRGSRDPLIERNVIVDNARGIGLGLIDDDVGRAWSDEPCGAGVVADHYGGIVRNNFIAGSDAALFASSSGMDGGIALADACDATVVHNTVFSTDPPFASIEYRFPATSGVVANNLVSHDVRDRGVGGPLTDTGNVTGAGADWFTDGPSGDLHLTAAASAAIDAASPAHSVPSDIDGDARGGTADVGADER